MKVYMLTCSKQFIKFIVIEILFRRRVKTFFRLPTFSSITDLNMHSYITFLLGTERCFELGSVMQNTSPQISVSKTIHHRLKLKLIKNPSIVQLINCGIFKPWNIKATITKWYTTNHNNMSDFFQEANQSISYTIQHEVKLTCDYFLGRLWFAVQGKLLKHWSIYFSTRC